MDCTPFFVIYSLNKCTTTGKFVLFGSQFICVINTIDRGLRAVKSVLVVAGGFKRMEPDLQEEALLMRALRDFNIPKIVR